MHALDILEYGHKTVLDSVAGLTESAWNTTGAAGEWTPKDIMAHLASFEHILLDVLEGLRGAQNMPTLNRWLQDPARFNTFEVKVRQHLSAQAIVTEYTTIFDETINQIIRIPEHRLRQAGALPWYGAEYDVEDFIVYTFYGHKREHSAQIAALRGRLTPAAPTQLRSQHRATVNGGYQPYLTYPVESAI